MVKSSDEMTFYQEGYKALEDHKLPSECPYLFSKLNEVSKMNPEELGAACAEWLDGWSDSFIDAMEAWHR